MDGGAWQATVHRVAESDMTEQLTHLRPPKFHVTGSCHVSYLGY